MSTLAAYVAGLVTVPVGLYLGIMVARLQGITLKVRLSARREDSWD